VRDTAFIISAGAAGEIGYSDIDFWAADDVYFLLTPDFQRRVCLFFSYVSWFMLLALAWESSTVNHDSIRIAFGAVVVEL
jgi:hypothetical protein